MVFRAAAVSVWDLAMLRGKITSGAALAPYGMSRVELALAACKARPSLLSCSFNSYSYICPQE